MWRTSASYNYFLTLYVRFIASKTDHNFKSINSLPSKIMVQYFSCDYDTIKATKCNLILARNSSNNCSVSIYDYIFRVVYLVIERFLIKAMTYINGNMVLYRRVFKFLCYAMSFKCHSYTISILERT